MTRGDKFLLAGILAASLLSAVILYGRPWLAPHRSGELKAVVSVQGNKVREIALAPGVRSSFVVQGTQGAATIEVEGTRLRMQEAPCPGQVCVRQGWIDAPGESIVCVPGRILVRIEGAAPLDAVTR